MKRIITLTTATLLSALYTFAQFPHTHSYHDDPGALERSRNIDVEHLKVEITINPKSKSVQGTATNRFKLLQTTIDTLFFHAPNIQIKRVLLDGKIASFYTNPDGLIVKAGIKDAYHSMHEVVIDYNAFPQRGLYFIGWDLDTIEEPAHMSRRQIWTQGQGIDNRHWIPMIDDRSDKFTTETIITFNKDYQVLSNGALISQKENKKDGTKTWHYRLDKPHAGYLIMLAIDNYAVKKSKSKKGIEHQFWYYPEHPERVEPTSRYSEEILDFLADEIGVPYPWGSYSQVMVQDFLYGAMENTSATVFGDFFWVDNRAFIHNRNYVSVNAHEATHQWFGDLITGRKDNEQWLQESFATFYPGLVEGHLFSKDHEAWYFRNNMNGAIAAGKANSLPVRHSQSGSSRHYPKGASILYMLQHQIGRDNFRRAITHYLNQHAYKGVETWDLQKAFIDVTGINVDPFFDQWIHRGGEPNFSVRYHLSDSFIHFNINQTHTQDAVVRHFEMPVDMAVYYKDGNIYRFKVTINKTQQSFEIPKNGEVDFILFDEGSYLLKELDFPKSVAQYLAQFEKATYMLDRYDALIALRSADAAVKRDALIRSFSKETFSHLRAEIASQLLQDGNVPFALIQQIARDPQHDVRLAFAQNAPIITPTEALLERMLLDSSYVIIETVFDRIYEHPLYATKRTTLLDKINNVDGFTHGIKIKYLEKAQAEYPKMGPSMRSALVEMTGPKYEFRTRILAIQALQRLNFLNVKMAQYLIEAASNFNSRLNAPAWETINYYLKQTDKKAILQLAANPLNTDTKKTAATKSRILAN